MPRLAFVEATIIPSYGTVITDGVIIVKDQRIEAIGSRSTLDVPRDVRTIDCRGRWIMPGLIDAHVHFFQSGGIFTRPDVVDLQSFRSYKDECAWIRSHVDDTLSRYLAAGITSVVDNGGPLWNYTVRAQARSLDRAPRVAVAGPLISSVDRLQLDCGNGDLPIIKCTTPEHARALVRRQISEDTDFSKIWWLVTPEMPLEAFRPVAEAVVDESHAAGVRVLAHAMELETARAAVTAGADVLVHSVGDEDIDDAFVSLLLDRAIVYCPTLSVKEGYHYALSLAPRTTSQDLRLSNPDVLATLLSIKHLADIENLIPERRRAPLTSAALAQKHSVEFRNLRKLRDAGVQIAAGTDAGNIGTLHASSMITELLLMGEAGLTPAEILSDATYGGACLMGRSDELGTLEAGKLADFIVLSADPLLDLRNLMNVTHIVKDGHTFAPFDLVDSSPEMVVQRQINAYNAHNIDAFTECYTPDVRIEDKGEVVCDGRDSIRDVYASLFANNPNVHALIEHRDVNGSTVTDSEHVLGLANENTVDATVSYAVTDGSIAHVSVNRI